MSCSIRIYRVKNRIARPYTSRICGVDTIIDTLKHWKVWVKPGFIGVEDFSDDETHVRVTKITADMWGKILNAPINPLTTNDCWK